VLIGNVDYNVERLGLKKWLELEDIKATLFKATDNKDSFTDNLLSCLSVAFNVPNVPWYDVVQIFVELDTINTCKDFPILKGKEKNDKYSWEYEGRTWYLWAHTLAHSYGWSLNYIANLDPNDAIALMQEIYLEEQFEKEWQWGLSEIAYPYNPNTKKSEFKELSRPSWMHKEYKIPKQIRLPAHMFPVGIVVDLEKEYAATKSAQSA
jgi:hypothetical protein